MKTHELKTWPDPYEAVFTGRKHFEYRKDDRGFQVGDLLLLRKWDPTTSEYFTNSTVLRRSVTYIARGPNFGIPDGYCVMSLGAGT